MGKLIPNQNHITRPSKNKKLHIIWVEDEEEEMSTETHEDVPTLPTKTNLTVMCDHTYGSSIH